jgi:CelD/BcsL family acetyltransferase involved in cellulose biosynthesis
MVTPISTAEHAMGSAPPLPGTVMAHQPASAGIAYAVSLCSDATAFEALTAEWDALLQRAARRNTFLTHEWIATWWKLIRSASGKRQLFILIARDPAGKLCGVLPLELESVGVGPLAYRILRFAGTANEAPEHLDVIDWRRGARHSTSSD